MDFSRIETMILRNVKGAYNEFYRIKQKEIYSKKIF